MNGKIKLYQALAAFQQEVPVIHEGSKGYAYTYASLGEILKTINPLLAKHNLGFTQLLDGVNIKTIIFSTEVEATIESVCEIPNDVTLKSMNKFQVMGSAITYYRRYALSSALGLVTDVDKDASGDQQPQAPKKSAIEKARPKVKQWITEEQFEKAKGFTADQLETVFDRFQFRDKAQEEELQEIYNNLKSNK